MKNLIMILTCLFASIGLSVAQTKHVSGTVLDDTGETAIGASVVAKGSTVGTITDLDGKFSLEIPSEAKTIVISLIGSKTKEVAAGTNLKIVLEPDSKLIDEVVVTGYGSVKKASFTGSASVISTSKLEDVPTVSLEAKLAGAVAGISGSSASGQPGAVESVRIRGLGSVGGSIEPLYVIDGVPMSSGNISEYSYAESGTSILSSLNSNDIESITVIKDAAAASLYGSRAANGVVVITTKGGKSGKTKIGLRANWGFSNMAVNYRPTLNGDDRRELLHMGLVNQYMNNNAGATKAAAIAEADRQIDIYAQKPETGWENWRDRLLRTGSQQNYEVNMQGGNDKTTFYSSLSYTDMEGITLQSDFQRITGRLNITHKMDKFTFGSNVTFSNTKQNQSAEGTSFSSPIMAIAAGASPQDYAYNPDGTFNTTNKFNFYGRSLANPLYNAELNYNKSDINRFLGSIYGIYNLTNDISIKETFSYDFVENNTKVWWDPRSNDGQAAKGVFQKTINNQKTLTSQTHLMYNKTFNKVHNFDALVGYEIEKFRSQYIYASGTNYPTTLKPEIINAGTTSGESNYKQSHMISYVAKANYDYDNKYYIGASFRKDGSSRFAPNKRWGNFWSLSGAWRISQEEFMKDLANTLSDAKVRLSYGTNGNLPYDYYSYLSLYNFGANYNGNPGGAITKLGYNDLRWEKSKAINFGLDLTFINRINVTIDLYDKTSSDLLLNVPVSQTTGFEQLLMNVGKINNRGIEFEIKSTNISTKDFYWSTSFNIAHNRNRLKEIDGTQREMQLNNNRALMHRVGESFNSIYGYEYAGVDKETGKALYYVNKGDAPRAKTDNPDEAQQVILAKVDPTIQGGLTNTFTYKGFDLNFTFTYSLGGHLYDGATFINSDGGTDNYNGNIPAHYKISEIWSTDNKNGSIPQFVYGNTYVQSSRWIQSTDHLRLKNITLGYTLPKMWLSKLNVANARVYASAANLFTIKSSDLVVDPELPVNPDPTKRAIGVVRFQTPALRTVTFGVEVSF